MSTKSEICTTLISMLSFNTHNTRRRMSISCLNCNITRKPYHTYIIVLVLCVVSSFILSCVPMLPGQCFSIVPSVCFLSGRFSAVKSDSTHHFFGNACTNSGSLRFSQFSGCRLILSVYIFMSFDFPLEDCSEFGNFVITLIYLHLVWIIIGKNSYLFILFELRVITVILFSLIFCV